jgi:hypothetical protein
MNLEEWMGRSIRPGTFNPPGLVVAIDGRITVCGTDGGDRSLTPDDYWPITCLSKLVLADLALRHVDVNAPIGEWLPEVSAPEITFQQLLTHTAGLPLDLPIELYGHIDAAGVRAATLRARPSGASDVMYSNIGYGWIAYALERVLGRAVPEFWRDYDLVAGDEIPGEMVRIADLHSPFAQTDHEPIHSKYWRSLRLPWAGAFGTIPAISKLLRRFDVQLLTSRTHGPGGFPAGAFFGFAKTEECVWDDAAWGLGVEYRGTKRPHWICSVAPADSFGHAASSGLVVWQVKQTTLVIAGPRRTVSGWLLRHGPKGTELALSQVSSN